MTRRRGILDYVLGGTVGGLEGLAAQRAAEDERARLKAVLDRQTRIDTENAAAKLRDEQREAIGAGMVEASSYNPHGIAGGMDMPGATPRSPVFSQKIGGSTFVLPEAEGTTKHRATAMASALKRSEEDKAHDKFVNALTGRTINGKMVTAADAEAMYATGPKSAASTLVAGMFPKKERPRGMGGSRADDLSDEEKERQGRILLSAQNKNIPLMNAINTALANDPSLAGQEGRIAYKAVMVDKIVPKMGAGGFYKPPTPAKAGKEGRMAALLREAGVTPGGAPVAPAGRPTPVGPPTSGVPSAPPTPAAKPDGPFLRQDGSLNTVDAALARRRQLWDEIANDPSTTPAEKASLGPRP